MCDKVDFRVIHRQSFEHMSSGGLLDSYEVVICNDCGAGFASGIPPQSAFDAYYRDLSKYEYAYRDGKESCEDASHQEHLARLLTNVIPSREARILEIGCANAKLLGLLKKRGYANVFGIDPSPGCAVAADKLYGVKVFTHSIFGMPKPAAPYDFVVLLGVLEHIRDLRTAVDMLREQLSERGRICIAVPDAARLAIWRDAPFQEFSTEHINFFSTISLSNLMTSNGFEDISCEPVQLDAKPSASFPIVFGVFEKSGHSRTILKDSETSRGLGEYIRESKRLDTELRNKIDAAITKGGPMVIWGVGTHTRRLLANGMLAEAEISAFVDSSPKFQGEALQGIPIISPVDLRGRKERIMISSYAFQDEIYRQIRHELALNNEIILLYDR